MTWLFKKSFFVSICIGLFLALNFFMIFVIYMTPEFRAISFEHQLKTYFEIGFLFFTVGFLISTFFVFIIGGPLYLLASKYSFLNYFSCAFGGGFVVIVPYIICLFFDWNLPEITSSSGGVLLLSLFICGALSGIVFNFLEQKKRER